MAKLTTKIWVRVMPSAAEAPPGSSLMAVAFTADEAAQMYARYAAATTPAPAEAGA